MEKFADGTKIDVVGFVFKTMNFNDMLIHSVWFLEHPDSRIYFRRQPLNNFSKPFGVVADFVNVIHHDGACARINVIANIVQRDGKRKNIFAVKRRNKRFVELDCNIMRQLVAGVFRVFNAFCI